MPHPFATTTGALTVDRDGKMYLAQRGKNPASPTGCGQTGAQCTIFVHNAPVWR